MDYDPIRSCLLATPDELEELSGLVAAGADPAVIDTWLEAGLVATADVGCSGEQTLVHPTLAGIAALLGRPDRTITIERFSPTAGDGQVAVMFLSWDRQGRCIINDGVGNDQLLVTASQVRLLPGLLSQALRINPDAPTSALAPFSTTAAAVAGVFEPDANPTTDEPANTSDAIDLSFIGDLSHAWRATGAWANQHPDSSLTVFNSISQGLWSLSHSAAAGGSRPSPETAVELNPLSPASVLQQLGRVVTGAKVPASIGA